VGLFDFLRGKLDEDPILGGRGAEPTGLEVSPVQDGAWTQQTSASPVTAASTGGDGVPTDPMEMVRSLREAGGDPDKLAAKLRGMFPGAEIDVQQSTLGGGGSADLSQMMHTFFGEAQTPLPAAGGPGAEADPIAQIERLADLHRRGALTDAEFAAAKAKLLGP